MRMPAPGVAQASRSQMHSVLPSLQDGRPLFSERLGGIELYGAVKYGAALQILTRHSQTKGIAQVQRSLTQRSAQWQKRRQC